MGIKHKILPRIGVISIILITLLLSILSTANIARGDASSYNKPNIVTNRQDIWYQSGPFDSSGITTQTSEGKDGLYDSFGVNAFGAVTPSQYHGEIPWVNHDEKDNDCEGMWTTSEDSDARKYAKTKTENCGDLSKATDMRITAMKQTDHGNIGSRVISAISRGIFSISEQLVRFLNFNILGTLATQLNNIFGDTIKNVFLWNPQTGELSGFFGIMMAATVFAVIGGFVRYIKGDAHASVLLKEFLVPFFVAFLIAGFATSAQTYSWMGSTANSLVSDVGSIGNQLTNGDQYNLCTYNRTGGVKDKATMDQAEILCTMEEPQINAAITSQFGFKPSDLTINEENFGDKVQDAIKATFSADQKQQYNQDKAFNVKIGDKEINNIGYAWYVSQTNINGYNPITNDKVNTVNGQENLGLYIPDFLSNLCVVSGNNSEPCQKAKNIMGRMTSPDYTAYNMFYLMNIFLAGAIGYAAIRFIGTILFSQLMLVLEIVMLPIVPGLYMFPKTRDFAKSYFGMIMSSIVNAALGLTIFNLGLGLVAAVSSAI